MSQEVFQIIQQLNSTQLERQLVIQCAPVFAGEKISNLLIISNHNEKVLEKLIKNTDFLYFRLLRTDQKTTYLIFHKEQLHEYLKNEKVQQVFEEYGYTHMNLGDVLLRFQSRYKEYTNGCQSFPHEMGLILGYPVEDVIGFIENQGKNYLYSGYWKVYDNAVTKIELFQRYEAVTHEQVTMLASGMNMNEIISYYKIKTNEKLKKVS